MRLALSLYGTPFLRRKPPFRCDVVTLSDPWVGGGAFGSGGGGGCRGSPGRGSSHWATESPCNVGAPAGAFQSPKWKTRVCLPASVSMRKVWSSCQVIWRRPGTRSRDGAPNDLH